MSRRALTPVLAVAGAGAAYYLYSAGGNPKVAEKMAEHDASRVSNKMQSSLPGSTTEAKKQGEQWAQQAGAKLDSAAAEAKAKGNEFDAKVGKEWNKATGKYEDVKADGSAKFDALRKDTNKNINEFDKTVERKASEAKSGISSWFGAGK